jgi:transketolase
MMQRLLKKLILWALGDEYPKIIHLEVIRPVETRIEQVIKPEYILPVEKFSIPPEIEQQWKDLEPRILQKAREQSEQLLETANKKTAKTHEEFRQWATRELQTVERKTHVLSAGVTQNLREYLNREIEILHQKVVTADKHLSNDLLCMM